MHSGLEITFESAINDNLTSSPYVIIEKLIEMLHAVG